MKLGIDIGGTKMEVAILDQQNNIVDRQRTPTDRDKGYESICARLSEFILSILQKNNLDLSSLQGIGIGLPGAVSPENQMMINGNTNCFVNKPLANDLREKLGAPELVIRCANDANCFALAEHQLGSGKGHDSGVGIILGTGCGTGIILNNKIHTGKRGGAGEAGHHTLDINGPECYCGRRGCAELFISGHGFETLFKNETGVELSATEIFESEKWSGTYLPMYQNYLANFILNLTNILGPDYFVLGGGLSNSPHIYKGLQEKVDQLHFLQGTPAPRVQKHELGDSAGVIGAALLV